jgi:hypothetical protein
MKKYSTIIMAVFIASTVTSAKSNEIKSKAKFEKNRYGNNLFNSTVSEETNHLYSLSSKSKTNLKSAIIPTHRLDSMVNEVYDTISKTWVKHGMHYFIYDANGNSTLEYSYYWEKYKIDYAYKYEYTFNVKGVETSGIDSEWDTIANKWVNKYKNENTVNANGKPLLYIRYEWDTTNNAWINSRKDEYSYDANGNNTLEIVSYWRNSKWENGYKYDYTYDSNNNNISEIEYDWSSTDEKWENSRKYEYTYDTSGNMTLELESDWDKETSKWINSTKSENTYNTKIIAALSIRYDWNINSNKWIARSKSENTIDTNNNFTGSVSSEFDTLTKTWFVYSKEDFIFNNAYSYNDLLIPNDFRGDKSFLFNHMLLTDIRNSTYGSSKVSLHYSANGTIIRNLSATNIILYPNPTSEFISFKFNNTSKKITAQFYDITGKLVLSQTVANEEKIKVSPLTKGLYIYKIMNEGETIQKGKMVIE